MLVTDHVGLVDNLATGYETVGLVKSERAECTLEKVGMADVGSAPNTLTPGTAVERACKAARLSPIEGEKPVSLNARQVIELWTPRLVTLHNLSVRLATRKALARRHQTLITNKLEVGRLHETETVEMKHTEAVTATY